LETFSFIKIGGHILNFPIQNISNLGREIVLFNRQPDGQLVQFRDKNFMPYFYQESSTGIFRTINGKKVNKVFCKLPSEVSRKRDENSYEADVLFTKRYLCDKVGEIIKSPIKYIFIDIEIQTKGGIPNYLYPNQPITCISIYNSLSKEIKTFYLKDYVDPRIAVKDWNELEDKLLKDFIKYIKDEQPDILLGWNFIAFDYPYLAMRIKKLWSLNLAELISPIQKCRYGRKEDEIPYPQGISILDYLDLFKKIYNKEVSYALDSIAQKYLGKPPKKKVDFSQITEEIKEKNIEDIKDMIEIENQKKIISYYDEIRRMGKCIWEDLTWHCLDEQTELLTKNGWKKYNEIKKSDRVYSMNPKTLQLELSKIKNLFIYDYKGIMINYDNERINFCVTPNHKFLMTYNRPERNKLKLEENTIDSIPDRDDRYFFVGSEGYEGKFNQLTDNQIKLIGWIVSEGHFEKQLKGISIYQNKGKKANEIEELLNQENLGYSKYIHKKNKCINFRIRARDTSLYKQLLNNEKELPIFVYELSIQQKRLLIETMMKGDGHWQTKNSGCYYSKNKELLDQFQLLCILAGWNVSTHKRIKNGFTYYEGNIVKKPLKLFRYHAKKEIQYEGKIWCIENEYHNFLIRYKERIVLSGNSKVLDVMLLTEAKKMGIVLPSKKYAEDIIIEEGKEFEGAYRRAELGRFEQVYKLDLSSAYPQAIINFCLDIANLTENKNEQKIDITDRETNEVKYSIYVKQNPNTLLPIIAKKLIIKKDILKKQLKSLDPESEEAKDLQIKYEAIKALTNSLFGVTALKVFRLYDVRIASAITSIVRDLLHYVENKLQEQEIKVTYLDTDSIFCQTKEDPTNLLNQLVNQWAKEKYNKDNLGIEFETEGIFDRLLVVALCHYIGYLKTPTGIKKEIKGVEVKRRNSSIFMKKFQEELIEKVLNNESQEAIIEFIASQKETIKKVPIIEIGFPSKINNIQDYKSPPIFLRALDYSKKLFGIEKNSGETFYYCYVKSFGQAERHAKSMRKNKETGKKELKESHTIIEKNVLAYDEETQNQIIEVDYDMMIKRNILDISEKIFDALRWDKEKIGIITKPKKERKKKEIPEQEIPIIKSQPTFTEKDFIEEKELKPYYSE